MVKKRSKSCQLDAIYQLMCQDVYEWSLLTSHINGFPTVKVHYFPGRENKDEKTQIDRVKEKRQ